MSLASPERPLAEDDESPPLLSSLPQPGAVLRDLRTGEIHEESLTETWNRYFPDLSPADLAAYTYPLISSEDFWRIYAEPIAAFMEAARALRDALSPLSEWRTLSAPTALQYATFQRLRELVHAMTVAVRPAVLVEEDGELRQTWIAPALLSHLAMNGMQDLTGGRVRRCADCPVWFTAKHPGARFCSSRCRERVQKQRQRSRKKMPENEEGGE